MCSYFNCSFSRPNLPLRRPSPKSKRAPPPPIIIPSPSPPPPPPPPSAPPPHPPYDRFKLAKPVLFCPSPNESSPLSSSCCFPSLPPPNLRPKRCRPKLDPSQRREKSIAPLPLPPPCRRSQFTQSSSPCSSLSIYSLCSSSPSRSTPPPPPSAPPPCPPPPPPSQPPFTFEWLYKKTRKGLPLPLGEGSTSPSLNLSSTRLSPATRSPTPHPTTPRTPDALSLEELSSLTCSSAAPHPPSFILKFRKTMEVRFSPSIHVALVASTVVNLKYWQIGKLYSNDHYYAMSPTEQ